VTTGIQNAQSVEILSGLAERQEVITGRHAGLHDGEKVGTVSVAKMPVDMFPTINIPVVVVATFYSGMPPQQIEGDITNHLERFFTLASGIEHIESRSLSGVSVIKVYFQPGANADSATSTIANLAMADMRDLPPGLWRMPAATSSAG
jgi:multidrug efflux pump subunit AcrB